MFCGDRRLDCQVNAAGSLKTRPHIRSTKQGNGAEYAASVIFAELEQHILGASPQDGPRGIVILTTPEKIANLRREYARAGLYEAGAAPDPVEQFRRWFGEALSAGLREPNAMALATASPAGAPSVRMVLLKGFDERGFVFYTHYESRKGRELEKNPRAALAFFWGDLERQVRIEGRVSRVSREESDTYFASRPRGSRLGALASQQSRAVNDREPLEIRLRKLESEYEGKEIPRPPAWGGYRVKPETIEFWQGRMDRLHDRLRYHREALGWKIERLQP